MNKKWFTNTLRILLLGMFLHFLMVFYVIFSYITETASKSVLIVVPQNIAWFAFYCFAFPVLLVKHGKRIFNH